MSIPRSIAHCFPNRSPHVESSGRQQSPYLLSDFLPRRHECGGAFAAARGAIVGVYSAMLRTTHHSFQGGRIRPLFRHLQGGGGILKHEFNPVARWTAMSAPRNAQREPHNYNPNFHKREGDDVTSLIVAISALNKHLLQLHPPYCNFAAMNFNQQAVNKTIGATTGGGGLNTTTTAATMRPVETGGQDNGGTGAPSSGGMDNPFGTEAAATDNGGGDDPTPSPSARRAQTTRPMSGSTLLLGWMSRNARTPSQDWPKTLRVTMTSGRTR